MSKQESGDSRQLPALRVLLVHPGTQHAPRLAAELERRGLLWRFWTGVGSPKGRAADGMRQTAYGGRQEAVAGRRVAILARL